MADPEISGDHVKFQAVAQKAAELQPAADGYAAYRELEMQLADTNAMLKECAGPTLSRPFNTLAPLLLQPTPNLKLYA